MNLRKKVSSTEKLVDEFHHLRALPRAQQATRAVDNQQHRDSSSTLEDGWSDGPLGKSLQSRTRTLAAYLRKPCKLSRRPSPEAWERRGHGGCLVVATLGESEG